MENSDQPAHSVQADQSCPSLHEQFKHHLMKKKTETRALISQSVS